MASDPHLQGLGGIKNSESLGYIIDHLPLLEAEAPDYNSDLKNKTTSKTSH